MTRFGSLAQEAKKPKRKLCSSQNVHSYQTAKQKHAADLMARTHMQEQVVVFACQSSNIFLTTILELQSVLNGSFGQFVCIPYLINICFDSLKPGEQAGEEDSIEHDSQ